MGSTLHGARLYALLRPIAVEVRRRSTRQLSLVGHPASEALTLQDYNAVSESCTFAAYRTVARQLRAAGGIDLTNPQHRSMVVRAARIELWTALHDGTSTYNDHRMRNRERRGLDIDDAHSWDSWRRGAAEVAGAANVRERRGAGTVIVTVQPSPQERDLVAAMDRELHGAMAQVLSPVELAVVTAHYVEGRPQRAIAKDLVSTDPRYRGVPRARALAKAETRVNVMLCRARQRLRTALPSQWAARAREIA